MIGRFSTIDPAAEYYPEITSYSYADNDPTGFTEDGEMPGPVWAIIGIFSDYIMQIVTNYYLDNKDFKTSSTGISYWSLDVSGASGFVSGGISALTKMATSSIGNRALIKTIDVGVDILVSTVESIVVNKAQTK